MLGQKKQYADPMEGMNINNIKVRDHDELDEDSEGSEIGGDRDDPDDKLVAQQRLKTKVQQDWNYLKSTLGGKNNARSNWKDQQLP